MVMRRKNCNEASYRWYHYTQNRRHTERLKQYIKLGRGKYIQCELKAEVRYSVRNYWFNYGRRMRAEASEAGNKN